MVALAAGFVLTAPTATGVLDWLKIRRGTPLSRTATSVFLAAAIAGHGGCVDRAVTSGALLHQGGA